MGLTMVVLVLKRPGLAGTRRALRVTPAMIECPYKAPKSFVQRPSCWIAIKNRSAVEVQRALGLGHPRPCPLWEGLSGELKLFIAPPVQGWVLVLGSRIPDPLDDPDACYRFITALSRKVGQVQIFSATPILFHHAWVRADKGKVERAFAWTGATIWNQGKPTAAECGLGLLCPDYLEELEYDPAEGTSPAANTDKVPALAAKWSLDPGSIEEQLLESGRGITGEWSCRIE